MDIRSTLLAQLVSTSLTPRQMTVVFGLGIRLCAHMRTTLENGVLCNEQPSGSAVNNFFDRSNFEAKLHAVMSINFVLKLK